MSATASFVRLPETAVEELCTNYEDCLERLGESVADYDWSGYVIATLLPYLDERGIKLMKSPYEELTNQLCKERGATIFIFTPAHKDAYLARLVPSQFSTDEMRDYFNKFNATKEADIGDAMMDGITCIHQSLSSLDDDSVVILNIG